MHVGAASTIAEIAVCPFTVAVDSREQAPYGFENLPLPGRRGGKRLVVPVEYRGLAAGDYSIVGLEDCVAVERKSLEDLFATLGQGRERFEREIEKLSIYQRAAIMVEADWREICRPSEFRGRWRSRLNPRSVWGTVFSWSQRYPRVHWYAMGSRRLAELATFEILERFWKERNEPAGEMECEIKNNAY